MIAACARVGAKAPKGGAAGSLAAAMPGGGAGFAKAFSSKTRDCRVSIAEFAAGSNAAGRAPKAFQAKWKPVRIKKTRQIKGLESRAPSGALDLALDHLQLEFGDRLGGIEALRAGLGAVHDLSLIHISEPTRLGMISYAVFCLKKKK